MKLFSITISILLPDFAVGNNMFYYEKGYSIIIGLALSPVVMAQDRNVRLDLFGAANVVDASYDARFKGDSGLGFAVGVGYGFGIGNWYEIHGVGVPVRSTTWQVEENIISRSEPECPTGCILTRLRKARR